MHVRAVEVTVWHLSVQHVSRRSVRQSLECDLVIASEGERLASVVPRTMASPDSLADGGKRCRVA